jgi:hypothetical protein
MAAISYRAIASRYCRSGETVMDLILIIILLILLFGGGFGYYRGGYYSRVVVMASAGYSGLS